MPRLPLLPALLALLLVAVSACSSTADDGTGAAGAVDWKEMTSKRWRLVELHEKPIAGASNVGLQFEGVGRVSGHSGINQYMGSFQHVDPSALHFGSLASTRMAGPAEAMALEGEYLAALAAVDGAQLADGKLVLLEKGLVVMRFEALE